MTVESSQTLQPETAPGGQSAADAGAPVDAAAWQLDRSCAVVMLVGAALAGFGALAALVAGSVRGWATGRFAMGSVAAAAVAVAVGRWLWRRSGRQGVRPFGMGALAIGWTLMQAGSVALHLLAGGWLDPWRAAVDLLLLGFGGVLLVAGWRTDLRARTEARPVQGDIEH